MSSDSNFSLTEAEIVYELSSLFHASILDILGYGIYTSVYFGTLYLTCKFSYLLSLSCSQNLHAQCPEDTTGLA